MKTIMITPFVRSTLNELDISYCIIANIDSGEIEIVGLEESDDFRDLARMLFADSDAIRALVVSLEGQVLPRTWKQGSSTCVVCMPSKKWIVGVFASSYLDAVSEYKWAKQINEAVCRAFEVA